MPRGKYIWGHFREKLSKASNICVTDLKGRDWAISNEDLPNEIRTGEWINEKYVGLTVLIHKSGREPHSLVVPKQKHVSDKISGPFYIPDSKKIAENKIELEGDINEEWKPPKTDRESGIEWDGTKQKVDSGGAEKRKEVFDSGLDNKNDLI